MNAKKTSSLLIALMAIAVFLGGCVKGDFDVPPVNIPAVDFKANTTIAQLKASYTGTLKQIEDTIVIKGIVVANDESGNLYKKMIIQDETGGIELSLDKSYLYTEYKVGQRVFVKCQGMYIGDYNKLIQLGYVYNNAIGRLPEIMVKDHIFRDSLPGEAPEPVTINLADNNSAYISCLVKIDNVKFMETGVEFAPQSASATNRNVADQAGKELIVRTSQYANFAGMLTPSGTGTIVGVLSIFRTDFQLTIRDTADIIGFSDTITPPPGGSGTGIFDDPYNCASVIGGATGTAVWVKGFIVGNYETTASPFSPNFTGPFATNSNILIADSPDETNLANCLPVQLPVGDIRTALNLVDKPANKGKEVKVLGSLESYFSQPGVKSLTGYWMDGNGIIPVTGFFTEEFASNLGQFTAVSVTGSQVWGWANFDGGCAKMSGYDGGINNANEDWLISPAISLAGRTGVKMSFREAINYISNISDMKVLISTNYSGNGNPSSASWTDLTGFTRAAGNSWTFIESGEVSLAAYEGQTVYIAFKYLSTTSKAATWEIGRVLLTGQKK